MQQSMSKAAFLDRMRSERQRWLALLAEVGEPLMAEPGVVGDWSVKDIISHVTAYEQGLVEWLEAASRGECVEFPDLDHPDVDYRNALIFSKNRGRLLQDVLLESERVFQRLQSLVEALPEEELIDPDRTEWFVRPRWKTSRPLWQCLADDSLEHYRQHAPDIRAWLEKRKSGR